MVFMVLAAVLLCMAMVLVVWRAAPVAAPLVFSGFDGVGVIVAFVAFVLAAIVFGQEFGLALLLAFALHEAGHVLAYRLIGHGPTRFRMVPILSDAQISDRPLKTEAEALFVALMGPGFSLAPLVLAFATSLWLAPTAPALASALQTFALACGALNFVNLLPFAPLDGGRVVRLAAANFWPALAPAMALFWIGMFGAAALRHGAPVLLLFAAAGAASLLWRDDQRFEPLGPDNALTGMAAYVCTLAAHATVAFLLVETAF